MSIPGQPNYMPYPPYSAPQYDYMNGYRNYMPINPYAQNQASSGQNQPFPNVQQPQPTNNNIQFALIPSREVAQNATAEKGQTIYMMNQNSPEIYMKAADGFGLQSTRYFRLVEFNPEQENQQNQQMIAQNIDCVPREEFNRFVTVASSEIESIKQVLAQGQQAPQQQIAKPAPSTIQKKNNTKETEKND